jgi:hypothetical protein
MKYFKLCCAHEEVTRLNVEIHRLRTSIHDETIHTCGIISLLATTNPNLATELQRRWQLRSAVNLLHGQRLERIQKLSSYMGPHGIGTSLALPDNERIGDFGMDHDDDLEVAQDGDHELEKVMDHDDDLEVAQDGDHDLEKVTDFVLTIMD